VREDRGSEVSAVVRSFANPREALRRFLRKPITVL